MQIWTTFSPQKVCWELTTVQNKGKGGTSDWMSHQKIIEESLLLLKQYGIVGIRLVIFPNELTKDGKSFNWMPLDAILALCAKHKLLVDLCIGPFQYPHYPGIYLPEKVLSHLSSRATNGSRGILSPQAALLKRSLHYAGAPVEMTTVERIDDNHKLNEYGLKFLEKQLKRYGSDKRIHGFHFANEWPDKQRIAGAEDIKGEVSEKFMLTAVTLIRKMTKKPIFMNTNIDAADKNTLFDTFKNIFASLDKQGRLGFDIYPSQETWKHAPLQKIRRLFEAYKASFISACHAFAPCEIYFAEVEAQPWGNGRSWYKIIKSEINPEEQILTYSRHSLKETWDKHISGTPCNTVSLWGSDFWLSAHAMGVKWPMNVVGAQNFVPVR